jgi:hypothetical protein
VSTVAEPVEHRPDADPRPEAAPYRRLPARVRPEDMVATVETEPPPDPTMGRDPERDFMLRSTGIY